MTTFTIPAHALAPGVLVTSPGTAVPSVATTAIVTLTDPNNQWPAVPDNSRHIVIWGIQFDHNDGAGWVWSLFQGSLTDQSLWLPFGSRDKSGGLPSLQIVSSQTIAGSGSQVRLAIQVDSAITLGAQIAVA